MYANQTHYRRLNPEGAKSPVFGKHVSAQKQAILFSTSPNHAMLLEHTERLSHFLFKSGQHPCIERDTNPGPNQTHYYAVLFLRMKRTSTTFGYVPAIVCGTGSLFFSPTCEVF